MDQIESANSESSSENPRVRSEHEMHEANSVTRHGEATEQATMIAGEARDARERSDIHLDDLIVNQTEAVGRLAIGITNFSEQYAHSEENRRRDRRVYLVLIGCLLIIGLILTLGLVRLNSIAGDNKTNGSTIKDCVTPGGACYDRSQKNQASTIKKIIDSNQDGVIDTNEILDAIKKQQSGQ